MKKILLTVLQVAVTCFVLYLVFRDPARRAQMAEALGRADKWWIVIGVLVGSLTYVAGTFRFGVLLRAQGIFLPWIRVAGIFMVGLFFNLFGLGSTGGDVVKIFYVLREAGDKKTAAAFTVLMDRVVGLVALVVIAVGFVAFRYHWLTQTPAAAALVTAFSIVMAAAMAVLLAAAFLALTGLADRLPARLPGRAKIIELVNVFQTFGRDWRRLIIALLLSFVAHGAMFFTFYAAGRSLHAGLSLLDLATIMPIVNTIISLPISVAGVGVREKLFEELLGGLCGVAPSAAVLISVIGFCIGIVFCLLGGVVYLFYRSPVALPATIEEIKAP
jgi:uncharacterized membrane protein YbhN (UPF0104 family)